MKKSIAGIIQKINFLNRRLNLFDLSIFFVIFIVLVFFIYNRLQHKLTWVNVRVSVVNADWWYRGNSPSYWYAKNLKAGDATKDSFGNSLAEVVNVDNYDLGGPYRNIYVDLRLKVDFDKNKSQYLYEFKPLVTGSSILINFPKQQLRGLVVAIEDKKIEYSYKTIRVELKMVDPALAEKIVVGAKSNDANGILTAEVLDIKKETASYYQFSDLRGTNIKTYNPDYRDILVTLKVKTFEDLDRSFYISDAAVKIGSTIWFQFPNFSLENAKIIELVD